MKYFYTILLILSSLALSAQKITYRGFIRDSIGAPIPFVNLVALSEDTKQTEFTLTNEQGEFKIELTSNSKYLISLLHVNYERRAFFLNTAQENIRNELVLKEVVRQLDDVEVVYEIPIQIKEDSIIYSVDAFANGQERKLKEVLRKMPGVEVGRDGTVKVMGKKVTLVLVEDKTFFNGSTKLAIDNIPADAVDKIEILSNYNKVGFLKGLEESNRLAMNIKLKDDKKRLLFGDIDVAGGHRNRYQINPNLFLYDSKFSFNLLGDVNNYGKKSLSLEDYLSFQNMSQFLTNSKGFIQGLNDLGDYFFEEDYQTYLEKFGALNVQRSFNNKTDVSSFFMASNSNTSTGVNTSNSFVGDFGEAFDEIRDQEKNTDSFFTLGKINIDHKPSSSQFLNLNTSIRAIRTDEESRIGTSSLFGNNTFRTLQDSESNMIKQTLKYDNKLSSKHTLTLSSDFTFNQRLPKISRISNTPSFPINLVTDDIYQINQNVKSQNLDFSLLLKDYYVINRLNHLYISLGAIAGINDFVSSEFQERSDGSEENLMGLGFGNNINNRLIDTYLGVEYKFKKRKFTFKPGFSFHYYNWVFEQFNLSTKKNLLQVLPKLNTSLQIGRTEKVELNYEAIVQFPQIRQLALGRTLESFNTVHLGNANLNRLLIHTMSLSFDKFNLLKGNSISVSAQYNYSAKSIRNNVVLDGINSVLTPIEIPKAQNQLEVELSLSKKINHIKYNYRINYSYEDHFQFINNDLIKNVSNAVSNTIGIETFFEEWPNINVSYSLTYNQYESTFESQFLSNDLLLGLEYPISKKLLLLGDYSFTDYVNRTAGSKSRFNIANIILRYQKDAFPWTFEFVANNLFDAKFKRENTFNSFFVSDQMRFILPRIVMLRVSYKL